MIHRRSGRHDGTDVREAHGRGHQRKKSWKRWPAMKNRKTNTMRKIDVNVRLKDLAPPRETPDQRPPGLYLEGHGRITAARGGWNQPSRDSPARHNLVQLGITCQPPSWRRRDTNNGRPKEWEHKEKERRKASKEEMNRTIKLAKEKRQQTNRTEQASLRHCKKKSAMNRGATLILKIAKLSAGRK